MRRVEMAAWALAVAQVVHGFTPADTEAEGYVGLVGGLFLLVAALAGVYGLRTGRLWAPDVVRWTGLAVVVGFVAYHAVPWKSPLTNPYVGEPVGAAAWVSVLVAIAAGVWAAVEGERAAVSPASR